MNRLVITFILSKFLEQSLNQIREHFEPGVSLKIPPHLSVSYPFFFSEPIENLSTKLSQVEKNFSPIEVTLTGIGVFEKETQGEIIYAKVYPPEKLNQLFEYIKINVLENVTFDTTIFPSGKLPAFIPHITLAMKSSFVNKEWVNSRLSFLLGTKITLDKLVLYSYLKGDSIWKKEKAFILGTKLSLP